MWGSPSKRDRAVAPARRPAGRSASRCRRGRSRRRRRGPRRPGVTAQSPEPVSSMPVPSEVRAAAMSSVSRERSGRRTTLGPSAIAASTRARLVSDLLPGSETTRSTGSVGRGAGQRLTHPRTLSRSGQLGLGELRLAAGVLGDLLGLAAHVGGGAAGPPGQAGLALGVDRGEEQAAEDGGVLVELQALRRSWPGGRSRSRSAWPARVVGTSDAASTVALRRGARPVASAAAARIWAPALIRTSVAGSVGIGASGTACWATGTTRSVTFFAFAA